MLSFSVTVLTCNLYNCLFQFLLVPCTNTVLAIPLYWNDFDFITQGCKRLYKGTENSSPL